MQQVRAQCDGKGSLAKSAFVRSISKSHARLSLGLYLMVTETVIPASACPQLGIRLGMVQSLAVTH